MISREIYRYTRESANLRREREDGRDGDGQGVVTDRAVGAGEQEDPAADHAAGRLVGDVDCQPLVPLCDNP